ncbi:hypothetical protein L21SP3_02199 [Sedimentisphaera cyanobacteriorum]|uniref:Sialate O-acetylesterase domain-containing protein n=1 Tax=Sedimentisphaera cyanobacteriorum TaxID=1940790 RepID=A0A1Q2HSD9_9BACT|nr:sialate O-acetylesterase [Sedimentisphaera cyanobacteriorum]AQQ10367.1 hypothetical protein L21SP3_02199 [Sedimentisphaera cyanobacteriorum]
MKTFKVCLILFFVGVSAAFSDIWMPAIFSDGMILQRGKENVIWGTCEEGQKVEFSSSWIPGKMVHKPDNSGRWEFRFLPPKAGQGYSITIKTQKDQHIINDVSCGEVWVCSGQSNMDTSSSSYPDKYNLAEKIDLPKVKMFHIPHTLSRTPEKDVDAEWFKAVSSDPRTSEFSATGYYFGKKLYDELNVPIGLIHTAWGGSRIEPWTPLCGYEGIQRLSMLKKSIIEGTPGTPEYKKRMKNYFASRKKWLDRAEETLAEGGFVSPGPEFPEMPGMGNKGDVGIYNAMIHPIEGLAIKGFIWYQGEANRADGMLYAWKKKALVEGWRKVWDDYTLPFYYVQIAPYQYGDEDPSMLPRLQAGQEYAQKITKNTAMVIVNDFATINDIHPPQKRPVGERLAGLALSRDYGFEDLKAYSPQFESMEVENGKAVLSFTHTYGSLKSRNGKPLTHFEIAWEDGKFYKAKAVIRGDKVVVSSGEVSKPDAVRFAWHKTAEPNLENAAGLPAGPFTTNLDELIPPEGVNLAPYGSWKCSDRNPWNWDSGLTDGSWEGKRGSCMASGRSEEFPKHILLDLEDVCKVDKIVFGVPNFGSTKDVDVYAGKDKGNLKKLASKTFEFKKASKRTVNAGSKDVRYVKLVFRDNYDRTAGYDSDFIFITELEVWGVPGE